MAKRHGRTLRPWRADHGSGVKDPPEPAHNKDDQDEFIDPFTKTAEEKTKDKKDQPGRKRRKGGRGGPAKKKPKVVKKKPKAVQAKKTMVQTGKTASPNTKGKKAT